MLGYIAILVIVIFLVFLSVRISRLEDDNQRILRSINRDMDKRYERK